jgi:hypothetical protein
VKGVLFAEIRSTKSLTADIADRGTCVKAAVRSRQVVHRYAATIAESRIPAVLEGRNCRLQQTSEIPLANLENLI